MLFPTTLVGSYPQPEWLIDRERLAGRFPPRVRARELWRIPAGAFSAPAALPKTTEQQESRARQNEADRRRRRR